MKLSKFRLALFVGLIVLLTIPFLACAKPTPAEFQISSLQIIPAEVTAGETVEVSVEVSNIGGASGTCTLDLLIDESKAQTKVIKVAPKETETVSFTLLREVAGEYNIRVNDLSGNLRVLGPAQILIDNLLISPPIAQVNKPVTITADVVSIGEVESNYVATLLVDKKQLETKEVKLAPMVKEKVSFVFTADKIGNYSIEVGGLSGVVMITESGDILEGLNVSYPELYQELLKLPDLKEIDERDKSAIENIAQLALNEQYKPAFESMLNEGIKDKRKYCAPLEALLWVAYDKKLDGQNLLGKSFIAQLIRGAWVSTDTSKRFSSERWQKFDEVVDRLNSPELIEAYLQSNYTYSYGYGEAEGVKSAEQIFKAKKGACYDHALLAGYCLKRNGYTTAQGMAVCFDRQVQGYFLGHIVCVYQDPKDSKYYIIDNAGGSRVHGPFESINHAAERACRNGSFGQANLRRYSLHDIDLQTGKYKTVWSVW